MPGMEREIMAHVCRGVLYSSERNTRGNKEKSQKQNAEKKKQNVKKKDCIDIELKHKQN